MGCQAAALSILRTVKKINYKIWNPVWSPNCYDITRKKLVEEYTVPRNLVIRKGSFRASRPRLKCDGTRAETRFRLSAKRTSLFKSAGGGGLQFSRLLAAVVCASAVVMLDTPCSEVV